MYDISDTYAKGVGGSASRVIAERIAAMEPGTAFVPSDFHDVADPANARQVLRRMERRGDVVRAVRGVYARPRRSEALGVEAPPSPDEVARAIARGNGWAISPAGDLALNLLGLDEQVPATHDYVSTGPYRTYDYGRTRIRMRHSASRDLVDRSPATCLVVQALRALGRENVDGGVVAKVAERLSDDEAVRLYDETRNSTSWVFDFARRVREARGC